MYILFIYLLIWLHGVLVAADRNFHCNMQILSHGTLDLSSPTQGGTQAPCVESMEFQPLDHQGSPTDGYFTILQTHVKIHLWPLNSEKEEEREKKNITSQLHPAPLPPNPPANTHTSKFKKKKKGHSWLAFKKNKSSFLHGIF